MSNFAVTTQEHFLELKVLFLYFLYKMPSENIPVNYLVDDGHDNSSYHREAKKPSDSSPASGVIPRAHPDYSLENRSRPHSSYKDPYHQSRESSAIEMSPYSSDKRSTSAHPGSYKDSHHGQDNYRKNPYKNDPYSLESRNQHVPSSYTAYTGKGLRRMDP